MKRTATAFVLLASLGGCMTANKDAGTFGKATKASEVPALQGPMGEPVAAGYKAAGQDPGLTRADYKSKGSRGEIIPAGADGMGFVGKKAQAGYVPVSSQTGMPGYYPGRGILPVPASAPYGAVAAVGALPSMGMQQPINARTSVRFSEPAGMKVTWYGPNGLNEVPLETPARYNFAQGGIYRLKMSSIQGRPGLELYPTLEIAPATPKTATYLAHSSVPLSFTDDDFEQVSAGNYLVKVVYLPDPQYQDLAAVAGPAEVISTRLEPGVDPVAEARRRGEILLIVRMGNIDLQAPNTPPLDAPSPYTGPIGGGPAPKLAPVPMPIPNKLP
jgi:hypothetical protein